MDTQYDVIIIGAGPAGLSAAIYASRANLKTLILEGNAPGGKLVKTFEIQNYPGIKQIGGVDLAMQMMEHGLNFGAELLSEPVTKVEKEDNLVKVSTAYNHTYVGKTLIIATGTQERTLPVEGADKYTGRGVSYCAVCDGAFYRDKDVIVVGGGNSALEETLYLTGLVNKVHIVIRRDEFRADALIVEEIKKNPKVDITINSIPDSLIIEDNKVKGLNVKNVKTNEITPIYGEAVFPYIGADPVTDFLKDLGILDEKGYIKVNSKMETSVKGIYAAGDVTVKDIRQVVTASNDGAIAALSALKYVK